MRIGIDIGGTSIRMGIVDGGEILKKISEPCKSDKPEKETIDHIITMLYKIMNSNIGSIGVGVPSVVDTEKGIVYNAANIPSWKEVHLKSILEKEFRVPVHINNDCNCFAFGERYFGSGTAYRNIVCVASGTGLGAGIIIDDKLYCGNNNGAGEIGSLSYLDYNYEYYCSNQFFEKKHNTTGKIMHEKALAGNREALKIWDEFGCHLGNILNVILYAYDPQAIIIGGGMSASAEFFSERMFDVVHNCPFPHPGTVEKLNILFSHRADVNLLGASALIN